MFYDLKDFVNVQGLIVGVVSDCILERERLVTSAMRDYPIPVCDKEGHYRKKQCSYSFGVQCWCVDNNGNLITGTKGDNNITCTKPGRHDRRGGRGGQKTMQKNAQKIEQPQKKDLHD